MMKCRVHYFLLTFLVLISLGCNEDETRRLGIELVTLDEERNERNEFSTGANVQFMLKVTNHTVEEIVVPCYDLCAPIQDPTFLRVYRKSKQNAPIFVGRPVLGEVFCATANLQCPIPSRDFEYAAGAEWYDNPENGSLHPGRYFTDYTIDLQGEKYYTYTEFSVK